VQAGLPDVDLKQNQVGPIPDTGEDRQEDRAQVLVENVPGTLSLRRGGDGYHRPVTTGLG